MWTFERGYEVGGERFELYAQEGGDDGCFQLVDGEALPVGGPFAYVPDERTVAELVHAVQEVSEASAA
jgi:hypothetical protein